MSTPHLPSVYLGPDHGMWRPKAWQDVVDAQQGGLLDESHWLDLKRELTPGRQGNQDLAVDIAAMALDSGQLLYGMEDRESRAINVCGVELAGLAERIDQVARSKVHPPVLVRTIEIPDPNRAGWGCVLVLVPASSQAPHMVDNIYYGRGDKANHRLSDEEVRRAMAARDRRPHDVEEQLGRLRDEDPTGEGRKAGHLYLVAQPLASGAEAMVALTAHPSPQSTLQPMVHEIVQRLPQTYSPTLATAIRASRRADGLALSSHSPDDRIYEGGLIDLVLREDGGIAMTCGRGTDIMSRGGLDPIRVVVPVVLLGLTHSALMLAGLLAERHTAYQGAWAVGLLVDRLKATEPSDRIQSGWHGGTAYSRDEYVRTTETTTAELADSSENVVQRLLGTLLRGLAVDVRYLPYTASSLRNAAR
ncbi:hypothetical protein GCM10010123_46270 [Pilimelia anulata]|uniref:Schlafen AlbA-2 domain-containing protein n=1 Tax=Pilimelia anulata TaxID=53371 RepID=A0A8J3BC05_9ACTN|nr:hypothetical protein [Pilimelia anulata]GGK11055.1 hypothetical protein GCM10010123_46270 [Pilimelia anulata]